jgi:hypothetical protein
MKAIKYSSLLFIAMFSMCESSSEISQDCIDPAKKTEIACYMIFKPVCGCDGVTYGNSCIAGASGVKSWTQGACK